jgi:polyadenylate-binding protein
LNDLEIIKYQPKDHREARRIYNNIYVKDFDPSFNADQLKELFGKYGDIKSCVVMQKPDRNGQLKPFAFICYERQGESAYGPECADKAVNDLHGKSLNGYTFYVQPALPLAQRQAQVQREQTRFKNSKKKCNLFVKNFPANFTTE